MLVGAYLWATSMSKRMKRFSLSRAKSSTVSFDQTHHIGADSKPLYPETFRNVLSFHKPLDLAAVISENGDAFHIRLNGKEAYSPKFKLTFGMYEGRAAVCDFTNQWFHIDQFGQKTYSQTFAWCGNFSKLSFEINGSTGQAPVRNRDSGTYSHIDQDGKILGGPYLYTGDINTQNQFVAWNMSNQVMICNFDGSPWSDKLFSMNLFDARTPHKGIAAVKDEKGWFYINRHGEESSGGARYAEVESHYNGQARVKSLDGTWLLIDESGQLIANFGQPQREMEQDLIKTSQNYWSALGLKSILDNKIIDRLSGKDVKSQIDDKLHKVLLNVSVDMGLCTEVVNEESGNSNYEITKKGMLLSSDCIDTTTKDKCTYWLQNRYFKHWLPSDYFKSLTRSPQPDTFLDISTDKSAVSLSQKVLASYSKDDWKGITTALSISDLINEHAMKQHQSDKRKSEVRRIEDEDFILADLGGGTGSLVSEIASNLVNPIPSVNLKFMCIDRPEVIDLVHKSSSIATLKSTIHFVAGDLFNNVLPSANVYLLSRVLHDWDDERASEILSRIRLYSPEDTTLFVIDRHSSKMNRHSLLSLHMYNIQRSHERTSKEWQELFYNSGWKSVKQSHFNGHEILTLKIDSTFLKTDGNNSISSHNNTNQSGTSMTKKRDGEMRVVATSALPTVEAGVLSGSRVRKAVIPIAGLGTRMLPQSIVTPKAFLPIITKTNGIVSADPALSHLLSQILSENTGISEICIVASPDQESVLLKYLQSIKIIYPNAVFHTVLQSVPLGFGDAILCAKDFVQKEAFLVALGDHVFTPGSIQQVLESYQSLLHQLKAGNVDKNNQILSSVGLTGACLCSESEIPQTGLLLLTPMNSSGNDSYNDVIIYTPTISESSGRSINESKSSSVKGTDTGTEMKHYGSGITSITGSGGSPEYGKVKRVAQMAEKPVHYDEFTVQDNFTGKSTYHAQLVSDPELSHAVYPINIIHYSLPRFSMFIISPHFFRTLHLFLAFSLVQLSGTHRLYFTFEPLYPTMSCLKNTSTTFYPFSLCPYILLPLLPALLPIFHLNFPISFISFSIFSISFFCVTSRLAFSFISISFFCVTLFLAISFILFSMSFLISFFCVTSLLIGSRCLTPFYIH